MVAQASQEFDAAEADADRRQGCLAQKPRTGPCAVVLGYQGFAVRIMNPSVVFAQLASAFALAQGDPRFVGVNIVAPEDHPVSLSDYALHMRMLQFLKTQYPDVKLSLHAGEPTLGLVAARELRFHVSRGRRGGGRRPHRPRRRHRLRGRRPGPRWPAWLATRWRSRST